jgi:serine/threonine protein kinase
MTYRAEKMTHDGDLENISYSIMPKLRGGELIGSGGYGCVFKPAIECAMTGKRPDGNTVGKIFDDSASAFSELENNQVIKRIDPEGLFTVKQTSICKVRQSNFRPEDGADRCDHAQHSRSYQIVYEYGGVELHDVIKAVDKGEANAVTLESVLPTFENALQGLVRINEQGFQHQDIKPYNLLVHDRGVLIIDFGLMQAKDKIYSEGNVKMLGTPYNWYPPEYKLASMTAEGEEVSQKDFVESFGRGFSQLSFNFILRTFKGQIEQLKALHADMKGLNAFKDVSDRVDVYGMGISMLQLLIPLTTKHRFKDNALLKDVYRLVHAMIQFDPRKRMTPAQVLTAYREIMTKHGLRAGADGTIGCEKLNKTELVKIYTRLGVPSTGTKKDLCGRWGAAFPLLQDFVHERLDKTSCIENMNHAMNIAQDIGLDPKHAASFCAMVKSDHSRSTFKAPRPRSTSSRSAQRTKTS